MRQKSSTNLGLLCLLLFLFLLAVAALLLEGAALLEHDDASVPQLAGSAGCHHDV